MITEVDTDGSGRWRVVNDGAAAETVTSARRTFELPAGATRMLRHGWQSWSPTDVASIGSDSDPSLGTDHPSLLRWWHHADPAVATPGELRSELFTSIDGAMWGAVGAHEHDTTFRLQPDGRTLVAEAWLGGATLAPGEVRELHPVRPFASVAAWAGAQRGRAGAPFQVGWCSWYQYFHDVTEAHIRSNLAIAARDRWPFSVFQIDDGYQREIGDWLVTNEKFPTPIDGLAAAIAAEGFTPGIWIAPFLVSPRSDVAAAHPEWLVRYRSRNLIGNVNPGWGGEMWVLDTTQPAVLDHLEGLARSLRQAGYPYLKLDFTYAPALPGTYADPSLAPAARVRAGYDAIRRGAGDDTFLLACGAPLGPVMGAVDGCRIGPDVGPWWTPPGPPFAPDYAATEPSTEAAWRSTVFRQPMHRRLWLNDPDCLLLRPGAIPEPYRTTWAMAVAATGGMVLLSDDLSLLGPDDLALFRDVVTMARDVDQSLP